MKDQQVVLLDEIREEEELLRKSMELILTSKEKIATKKLALQDRLFITELLEQKLYDLRVAPQNSQREIGKTHNTHLIQFLRFLFICCYFTTVYR